MEKTNDPAKPKNDKASKKDILKHSTAHVLAAAVLEMFPEAKFGIGPATEKGFYYDFELPRTLIPEDLPILEQKMKNIIKENHKFTKKQITIQEAIDHFKKAKQPYKVELIKELKKEGNKKVTIYKSGSFVDLCSGPHLNSTGQINVKALKLTTASGAYWRADERNIQLQRVHGVVFSDKKELKKYIQIMEEAEKRDHKKLGKEMDLFSFHPEAPGSPFWHPKGMIIWNELEKFGKGLRKKYRNEEIQTPQLAKSSLWKTSGHWDHYKDSILKLYIEREGYCLKPMDCPFNIKIYQTRQKSYRELPIRYTETGRVFRNEQSGELNGLFRVRTITQDDAHIFCTSDQVVAEIQNLLKMVNEYYKVFDIKPVFYLSTRPEDYIGDVKTWNKAEKDLKAALQKEKSVYEVKEKNGAFYGPKIDLDIEDALGRKWQLATIQLDFQLPERFKLEYVDKDGKKKQPVIIHAAIFGSYERFIGIMIEHYGGKLPLWLSPVQAIIIPVSEKFSKYADEVNLKLKESSVRSEVNMKAETLGKRISEAEKQKVPYMLVVGEKEMKAKSVAVRQRGNKEQEVIKLTKFSDKITKEIEDKK